MSAAPFIMLFILGVAVYCLPMAVAVSRSHPNRDAIGVLNLLLGWTFIGWVAALVWASMAVERRL